MYGGGFATVPAYLADMFGTQMVGAIHGRLLTAWADGRHPGAGGRELHARIPVGPGPAARAGLQPDHVHPGRHAIVGLICNLLVRPLNEKWFMTDSELAQEKKIAHERSAAADARLAVAAVRNDATPVLKVWLAWLAVGIPLAWGVYRTLLAAAEFFR